ncbi:MAG TPA: acyl-CoA dehydrogenase family protein [Pseudonocardiaceae bacterium]|jgi:alkylation response protein AidB-like acyl-CoA dehydrogenase|nr:acyl-CoA dehydrogenase family protein [Pseudonocardiaceae bacterium]
MTTQQFRAEARALVPVLATHAARTEQDRRLADDSLKALWDAGMLRLGTPRAHGGHGVGVRTATEVCAELARGCASSSWLVGIAYGGNLFASQFADEVRDAIWADNPDAFVCGAANPSGTVRPVPGGLVLTGAWPWISGILHARWLVLGVQWSDGSDGEVHRGLALVPTESVELRDTWYMAGMRGTGSNTAAAEDLFVPEQRVLTFDDLATGVSARRHPDEPRVTFPLSINLPLVGTGIGIAQAALAHVVQTVAGGKRDTSPLHQLVADAPAHQLNVADAATLIDTARLHLSRATEELDRASCAGRQPDLEARSRLRMDGALAMRCARDAVGLLLDTGGASGFADSSPLQRAWRDIETASRHAALSAETSREIYGRVLLGAALPASPVI